MTNLAVLSPALTLIASTAFWGCGSLETMQFATTNLVVGSSSEGGFPSTLKDIIWRSAPPARTTLDNILDRYQSTNIVLHASKFVPGWRDIALPKAEALACDEWAARPEGTWGIYQTAVGKRFHIVHCESRDEKLTTTLLLVR